MKVNLKPLECKRGAGTIISFIMVLLISVTFLGGTFIWQVKSQTDINASENLRIDEQFSVDPTFSYSKVMESYSAIIKVENIGPVDIELVQAWIIDETNNDHKHIDISYQLPIDNYIYIDEIDELIESLSNPYDLTTTNYIFKVVTERGNIAASKLMPRAAFQSNWPAVIIPDASWIKKRGNQADIHLELWNRLDESLHLTLIVTSRLGHGAEHSELIEIDWIIPPRVISIGEFKAVAHKIYQVGSTVFIELANSEGTIVSSYYFTCE